MTVFNANNAFIKAFRDAQTTNCKTIIIIVRVLFENEGGDNEPDESALMKHLEDIVKKNKLSNIDIDREFAEEAIRGIANKYNEIDELIEKTSMRPLNGIGRIEINILRYGVFELRFGRDMVRSLDAVYVINELVELAKNLVRESTGRFINGVLSNLVPVLEKKVGGVIFKNGRELQFALVQEAFRQQKWTLSKGRLRENEGLVEGFKRAIRTEIGIEVEMIREIGKNFYRSRVKDVEVIYFLVKTEDSVLWLEEKPGLSEVRWFTYEQVKELNLHRDLKPLILRSMDEVMKKYSAEKFGWLQWIQNWFQRMLYKLR